MRGDLVSNQMKALCKSEPREGLWMTRAPVPEIGPDDVLIKITKTGSPGGDAPFETDPDQARRD